MKLLRLAWVVAAIALAGRVPATAADYVAVSATAVPNYQHPGSAKTGARPSTYIFGQGRQFQGNGRDRTAERMKFEDIVRIIAEGLAKENYVPAPKPAEADLLIVVNWGATQTYEDPNEQANLEQMFSALTAYRSAIQENGMADPGPLNQALADRETAAGMKEDYLRLNARLLGYERSLEKESKRMFASEDEKTMRMDLGTERYFVVLMAYDYQLSKKEHKAHLVWVTRFSVRSPGHNFAEAIPLLVKAATPAFGRNLDGLTRSRVDVREGVVEVGQPEVVEQPAMPKGGSSP